MTSNRVWFAWFGFTTVIVRLVQRWPLTPARRLNLAIHGLAAVAIGVVHVIYWLVLLEWLLPFDRMTAARAQIDVPDILASRMPLELTLYVAVLTAVQALDHCRTRSSG